MLVKAARAVIGLPGGPGHVESARIFHVDRNLQCLPAFSQLEALDDMQLGRVRRAVIVDVGIVRKADRVDDQRIAALVVPVDSPYGLIFGCAECGTLRKTWRTSGPPSLIRRTSFLPCTKKSGLTRPMTRIQGHLRGGSLRGPHRRACLPRQGHSARASSRWSRA